MTFTPTPEQTRIVEAATTTKSNFIVTALAGAAKTSTLVLIAQALPSTPILCLAFNKKIADELQARLPRLCKAQTLNSIGHQAWSKQLNRRLMISPDKTYSLLTAEIAAREYPQKQLSAIYEQFSAIKRLIDFGKSQGYVPTDAFPHAKGLLNDEEFREILEEFIDEEVFSLIRAVSIASIRKAIEGQLNYDDQILLPTIFPSSFPQYPLVMIDEAQDLSPLNHAMLAKIAKKRLIAVGDPNQAIYGFRGAAADSMTLLTQHFSMEQYPLTISFRCPIAVVQAAQWKTPEMKWPEWAQPGLVDTKQEWTIADIPESAVILCRNNAPLLSMAFALLRRGRHPELVGNDISKALIKTLKGLGKPHAIRAAILLSITEWREAKMAKAKGNSAKARIEDQTECLRIFAEHGETLADILAFAEHIFSSTGPIKLMTIHKSKGLEFDHVFFLNEYLLGDEDQEPNLRYVAITRAKSTLTYVNSENFK